MIIFSKGHQGLASEEPLEFPVWKEVKGSKGPQERRQQGLPGPPAVLVLQVLWGSRDLQAHQVKMLQGTLLRVMPRDRGVPIGAMSLTWSLAIRVDLRCYLSTGVSFY